MFSSKVTAILAMTVTILSACSSKEVPVQERANELRELDAGTN